MMPARRSRTLVTLGALAILGVAATAAAPAPGAKKLPTMIVYKSPTCGCCKKWVEHAKQAGFVVTVKDMDDLTDLKADLGVMSKVSSCHTAVVDGYVIEGHVPADLVQKLLKERPKVVGLAAPGMPQASPGMDGPKEPYDIVTFDRSGKTTVYAKR
jgi:hypothetical protein